MQSLQERISAVNQIKPFVLQDLAKLEHEEQELLQKVQHTINLEKKLIERLTVKHKTNPQATSVDWYNFKMCMKSKPKADRTTVKPPDMLPGYPSFYKDI